MNANERTADALTNRANNNIAQLITRFESLIAYEPDDNNDRNVAAVSSYQMGVESAALVRAAEDILALTRVLKEAWLFGKLDAVGVSRAEERIELASEMVVEGVVKLGREGRFGVGVGVGAGRGGGGEGGVREEMGGGWGRCGGGVEGVRKGVDLAIKEDVVD